MLHVTHGRGLGDLQFEVVRIHAVAAEQVLEQIDEIDVEKLAGGDVDTHRHGHPVVLQDRVELAGRLEHVAAEVVDQA